MRNRLLDKRIPTLFGIVLITLGILLTNTAVKKQTDLKSKASSSQEPQNLKITNISDRSFTITYQTDVPTIGSISYGPDAKLDRSELEDTDKEKGSLIPKRNHSISIKDLSPTTSYYFNIISGSETFLNNDSLYETKTGPEIFSTPTENKILTGKIVSLGGNIPSEALVYLSTENSQLLSTTITSDGKFNFSLKELRTNDLTSYFDTSNNSIVKIFATDGLLESTVQISLNQDNSIPTITLSNNYDFTQEISSTTSRSADLSGFPSIAISKKNQKIEITIPEDDQFFTIQKPQFRGTSLPNEDIEIIIRSTEEIIAKITTDRNGNWSFKPSVNLSPGIHTITIKARDSAGILRTISKSFTIYEAKSPTLIPTKTQSPTRTISPTATPTLTVTKIPSPTPLLSPTASVLASSTTAELEPTGNSQMFLVIGGLISILIGFILLKSTNKSSL